MPRTRLVVLVASVPLVVFTLVGGFLGREAAGENPYRHLRILEDVVSLISNNYVEDVDLGEVMDGALRGLTEGLDADSAYLSAEDVDRIENGRPLPAGGIGVEVRRRYYLQVVAPLDGSPAARAGVLPGDFIRAIDSEPTRFMSAIEGQRLLRGEPGSTVTISLIRGSTQEPYDVELAREDLVIPDVTHRMAADETGYVRVASFGAGTASAIADAVGQLLFDDAASRIILDLRNSASGAYEEALVATRLFVADGTLAIRQEHGDQRTPLAPPPLGTIIRESAVTPGLGVGLSFTPVFEDVLADFTAVVDTPVVLLTNFGTAGPAELFVAALAGRDRAETVGQRTAGRASEQKLVRLPDGTGLWLSRARYLTPDGEPIDRVGVVPDVAVDVALPELGEPLPEEDPILERALEAIAEPI
ncbi:MAG: S41 family peptidase [Acidobacteria bacterium]|nr:S41 family peptidase [Acidobacteriota bacterium]